MRRLRVFIAGPIANGNADCPVEVLRANVRQAAEAGRQLLRAGHAPLIPHLSVYLDGGDTPKALPEGTTLEDWYQTGLAWIACADCVLRLPGASQGADRETACAYFLGIPVFGSLAEVLLFADMGGDS